MQGKMCLPPQTAILKIRIYSYLGIKVGVFKDVEDGSCSLLSGVLLVFVALSFVAGWFGLADS